MKKLWIYLIIFAVPLWSAGRENVGVQFVAGDGRVDVLINGQQVTSYLYRSDLTKPVLYPVKSISGIQVNRSYPLEHVQGESQDHPHHFGIFFTYDKVNGNGFWNNTTSPPQIRHVEFAEMADGMEQGTLAVVLAWVGNNGKRLLREDRSMVFRANDKDIFIDFSMTLTATDRTVVFEDIKEGMFAIRLADWLKEKGGTGTYLSSNGDQGASAVWGRRAKWVRIEGHKDGQQVGIAILNHPSSQNYPTYWHARDYGLFSANPLGQSVFQKDVGLETPEPYNLTLAPGKSALFKFRMIIYEGAMSKEQLDREFDNYKDQ
jgi:hypothetical protein